MTLRSLKKHPTTVLTSSQGNPSKRHWIATYIRTIACTAAAAISASGSVSLAQGPMAEFGSGDLRPVREVTANRQTPVAPAAVHAPVNETLRWRNSSDLKPAPHHLPSEDVFANDVFANDVFVDDAADRSRVAETRSTLPNPMRDVRTAQYDQPDNRVASIAAQANSSRSASTNRSQTNQSGAVRQAAWSNETRAILNEALQNDAPPTNESNSDARNDFFGDPFGESKHATASARLNRAAPAVRPRTNQQFNDYRESESRQLNAAVNQRLAIQIEMVPPPGTSENTGGSTPAAPGSGISNPFRGSGAADLPLPPSTPDGSLTAPGQSSSQLSAPASKPAATPVQEAPELESLFQDAPKTPSDAARNNALPEPSQDAGNLFDSLNGDSPAKEPSVQPKSDEIGFRDLLESVDPNKEDDGSMDQQTDPNRKDRDALDSPSDREELFENPFPKKSGDADKDDLDRLLDRMNQRKKVQSDAADNTEKLDAMDSSDKPKSDVPDGLTCDEFRQRISRETIQTLSLDISAPFRPDVFETDEYEKLKAKFDAAQPMRQWTSVNGSVIASGRLRDLAYEKAVIETDLDGTQEINLSELSEGDWAYISKNWGLPKECRLEQVAYQPRSWQPHTFTWKASNLCHKPLYFEEVNLERYGHTAGPILQPIVSSAHFFANIAVLPYKMGIHPPSECQYALGYYRPGNCAPWIIPPVPLSLRGAAAQAAVVTTGFLLIP